jgi:hypothetical protein
MLGRERPRATAVRPLSRSGEPSGGRDPGGEDSPSEETQQAEAQLERTRGAVCAQRAQCVHDSP